MHQTSYNKMNDFVQQYLNKKMPLSILDLGSQNVNGSYRPLFEHPGWTYLGVDLEPGPNVDLILADPYDWKDIGSHTMDVVISGQAFEHIKYFWVTMLEISRVLKTGGLCCIIAPSAGYEHRYPVDCWRFYADGFTALAEYAFLDPLKAYTQKQDNGVEGELWKDTVLVAEKKPLSIRDTVRFRMKNFFLKRFLYQCKEKTYG
ncbi:MAG: methyltransferase domain-containing protein [Desulfotignum sp.]